MLANYLQSYGYPPTPPTPIGEYSVRGELTVEIVDAEAFAALGPLWRELVIASPEPNCFMEPAFLCSARAQLAMRIIVLLAWTDHERRELVGAWALAIGSRPFGKLNAPAVPLAALGTPVIRHGHCDEVLELWFSKIAKSGLPKVASISPASADGEFIKALGRTAIRRNSGWTIHDQRRRAVLCSGLSGEEYLQRSVSSSRRRKLRQLRSRLERTGDVSYVCYSDPTSLEGAVDRFLKLEAQGWKGRRGTAIAANERIARFVRDAVMRLAKDGLITITALTINDRPISMCMILRSGRSASLWKIAFDEDAASFSPGYLLAFEDTDMLLTDGNVDVVDSCAVAEFGIMAEVWKERREVADVYFDVRRNSVLRFRAAMVRIGTLTLLPRLRRRLRLRETMKALHRRLRRI